MSVGAIDFGLIVDATVIMVENIFRHLGESAEARRAGGALLQVVRGNNQFRGKFAVIANAATEVNQSILFAAAIIIAGFVPLFTLSGIEGHIFGPMARTYGYAIAGGLIATFTISPALCALLLPDSVTEVETGWSAACAAFTSRRWSLRSPTGSLRSGASGCCWGSPRSRRTGSAWNSCRARAPQSRRPPHAQSCRA